MLTLCIRYTIDPAKVAAFEAYAQALRAPVERCGGVYAGYYCPTKIAGPTNTAFGFIDFPDLGTYRIVSDETCDRSGGRRGAAPSGGGGFYRE